jgi:hypothetical protein
MYFLFICCCSSTYFHLLFQYFLFYAFFSFPNQPCNCAFALHISILLVSIGNTAKYLLFFFLAIFISSSENVFFGGGGGDQEWNWLRHIPSQCRTQGKDALQERYLEVSGVAGAWRECDFNQQETYQGGRTELLPPASKLRDSLK